MKQLDDAAKQITKVGDLLDEMLSSATRPSDAVLVDTLSESLRVLKETLDTIGEASGQIESTAIAAKRFMNSSISLKGEMEAKESRLVKDLSDAKSRLAEDHLKRVKLELEIVSLGKQLNDTKDTLNSFTTLLSEAQRESAVMRADLVTENERHKERVENMKTVANGMINAIQLAGVKDREQLAGLEQFHRQRLVQLISRRAGL